MHNPALVTFISYRGTNEISVKDLILKFSASYQFLLMCQVQGSVALYKLLLRLKGKRLKKEWSMPKKDVKIKGHLEKTPVIPIFLNTNNDFYGTVLPYLNCTHTTYRYTVYITMPLTPTFFFIHLFFIFSILGVNMTEYFSLLPSSFP